MKLDLETPSGVAPAEIFAATMSLTLPLHGATGLVVDPATTVLQGSFAPLIRSGLDGGTAFGAAVGASGDALVVDLPRPLEVRRACVAGEAETLTLHRVDAARLSADPAVAVGNGRELPDPPAQFVAVRFGIRANDAAQAPMTGLDPTSLEHLELLARPASPQVLLADPIAPAAAPRWLPVFQAAGELGTTAPLSAGEVEAGFALAAAFNAALAGPLTATGALEMTFQVQSAAPCRFTLQKLVVGYRLVARSFGGPPHRRRSVTIRLDPAAGPQRVSLDLPAGSRVLAAQVRATESAAEDRVLGMGPDADGETRASLGVRIGTGSAAAAPVDVGAAAGSITGLEVRLLPLTGGDRVTLEVRADEAGIPVGRRYAGRDVALPPAGTTGWVRLAGPLPPADGGPCWVLVLVRSGTVLWLADPLPPAGSVPAPTSALPPLLVHRAGELVWAPPMLPSGIALRQRLVARPPTDALHGPDSDPVPVVQATTPPYLLDVDGHPVELPNAASCGVRVLDLRAALTTLSLSASSAAVLRFVPLSTGQLALDNLRVEYDRD